MYNQLIGKKDLPKCVNGEYHPALQSEHQKYFIHYSSFFIWDSFLAYPNLFGIKGFVVVVVFLFLPFGDGHDIQMLPERSLL
jgi:hypothetical protein